MNYKILRFVSLFFWLLIVVAALTVHFVFPNERVDTELRFLKPFESKADAYLITEPIGETQTKVRWGFDTEILCPMNVMLLFVSMDDMIGPDFESGLGSLKTILESR